MNRNHQINQAAAHHYQAEIDEKMSRDMNKLNLTQQNIPTEPITLIDSPKTGSHPHDQMVAGSEQYRTGSEPYPTGSEHDHQKAKFEAIFKSLDEMSRDKTRTGNDMTHTNQPMSHHQPTDESPWQLQKQFEQKPPTPEPQRQIPQVRLIL